MSAALARVLMALASSCLGWHGRRWALAMRAELDAATDDGRPLSFALGCLVAACREMPRHEEGRFVLASYLLALGLIIPIAAAQLACATGLPFPFSGGPAPGGVPVWDHGQQLYLASSYLAARPILLALPLLLCLLNLRLAWFLLERDWAGLIRTGSLCAAVTAALLTLEIVLLAGDARTALLAAVLPVELLGVAAAARWHRALRAGIFTTADPLIF